MRNSDEIGQKHAYASECERKRRKNSTYHIILYRNV